MGDARVSYDDDVPAEIDFSGGERGKFFRAGAELKLPVYLDNNVQPDWRRLPTPSK